ncbi:MAG: hypothetical protein KatS3mg011_1080 [Acidimicrobiia bacterium]|jgi:hypothetical protein|nr:MAG: hypothetical protein KatS3mg011_1080 [Acidimicrobiia bacterium]
MPTRHLLIASAITAFVILAAGLVWFLIALN